MSAHLLAHVVVRDVSRQFERAATPVFCPSCLAQSRPKSPGDVRSVNGIGKVFYGNAEKCPRCGSGVRVLWAVIAFVPLVPLGSYRYRDLKYGRFAARETRTRIGQVCVHWMLTAMVLALAWVAAKFFPMLLAMLQMAMANTGGG